MLQIRNKLAAFAAPLRRTLYKTQLNRQHTKLTVSEWLDGSRERRLSTSGVMSSSRIINVRGEGAREDEQ